jgi:hypothetical protein
VQRKDQSVRTEESVEHSNGANRKESEQGVPKQNVDVGEDATLGQPKNTPNAINLLAPAPTVVDLEPKQYTCRH